VLTAREDEVLAKAEALVGQLREQRRTIQQLQEQLAAREIDGLIRQARMIDGLATVAAQVPVSDAEALRNLADRLRDRLGSGVVALGAVTQGRPVLLVALTPDAVSKGLSAGKIAGAAARVMGGGGGGRPDIAQAGGKSAERLGEALEAVYALVAEGLH